MSKEDSRADTSYTDHFRRGMRSSIPFGCVINKAHFGINSCPSTGEETAREEDMVLSMKPLKRFYLLFNWHLSNTIPIVKNILSAETELLKYQNQHSETI